ncbi:LysR family transcriptional regulator [Sphingomonas profundi]|uniref:LysR family transcriptional regulator n=1 Tax=Alterirhizorhabdus profundi TaxID=2681549 RepID=UPI0012E71B06|nr:LysR family transcriptional regulator [Sphingomonas profundi]
MDMSMKPLRCFIAVAELKSFTRAAERVNLTQPSLSIQINQLEKYFGFRLFDRSTRHVTLTPPGAALFDDATRMVRESDRLLNAARSLRGDLSGRLRVGAALYTFEIPERRAVIEGFMDACPEIDLKVDAHTQHEILAKLAAHSLDIALVIGLGMADGDYQASDRAELTYPLGLSRLVLRRERIGLNVPADSPLAAHDVIPAAALRGQRVVVPSEEHGASVVRPILDLLAANGADPIVPPEATGTATERYGCKFRLPAITFGWFAQQAGGGMVRRPIAGFDLHTEFAILSQRSEEEGAAARFLNFARRIDSATA